MKVVGIGGLFVRAADPKGLAEWYLTHLGVGGPHGAWEQQAGTTVFAPFAEESTYFPPERRFMLNFRVEGLDALCAALRAAGIAVERRAEWDDPSIGRFARIADPEGNPIELWEEAAE